MKNILILILLPLVSCSSITEHPPAEVTVTIDKNKKSISKKYNLMYKDDIAFIFSKQILTDFNIGAIKNPFSYGKTFDVEGRIQLQSRNILDFSSFSNEGSQRFSENISNFVFGFAKTNNWTSASFSHLGTRFLLIKKKESKINNSHWKSNVKEIWSKLNGRFGTGPKNVTFVELNWAPISGGPLGENVLGIFYQNSVSKEVQKELKNDLGWESHSSTMEYVKKYYNHSKEPWDEYLIGTYSHELTHLYFGFGKTRQIVHSAHQLWFSLGMGMLYDIEITKEITGHEPAIFSASDKIWKEFAGNPKIDQRLVNPDVTNDKLYNLNRKKVYAHSKALSFLRALRNKIGKNKFDFAVKNYLHNCINCTQGYKDFKFYISEYQTEIKSVEKEFNIY